MKKEIKNDNYPKKRNLKLKKKCSIDNGAHSKINNYISQKLEDKINLPNQNITHINNINIVNMIMSKEKPSSSSIFSPQNRNQSYKKDKNNKTYKDKRNNTSLLIDYNKKMSYSSLSKEDRPKYKTNKLLLYSPYDQSKIIQILKYKSKKKSGLFKTKQKNRSYKQLSNIQLNLNKFVNKKDKLKRNHNSSENINININTLSTNRKCDFSEIKKKIKKKINREEIEEIINTSNQSNNYIKHTTLKKISKNQNRSNDNINNIIDMKDLLDNLNLNKDTETKEYIDSEMNFINKQENEEYDKDLEYLNINVPYTIKVNLNKNRHEFKLKNKINESIFTLNKSVNKNEFNNIYLIKDNNIKLEIQKSNIKYVNNKKRYIFENDDEIINFVKNKFKEKNSKYLSELQSKNDITNIIGNINNNNNSNNNTHNNNK